MLKSMDVAYYNHLYTADSGYEKFLISGFFPRLEEEDLNMLNRNVSKQEITTTIFSIGGWKAPSPNGLLAMFFQSNWSHVKSSVVE